MKRFLTLVTGTTLLAATPAIAQDTAAPAVEATTGMKIYGPNGGDVGSVESVDGDVVVVSTGKNKAALPISAFAKSKDGLSIQMTKTDLDAAVEKADAMAREKLLAGLTPGVEVKGVNGEAVVGTIKESDTEFVTIDHDGKMVKLPVDSFFIQGEGIALAMTEEQLNQAIASVQ